MKMIATVRDIVPDPLNGSPAYVLMGTDSGITAIPYAAVRHMLRDAHLVIDRSVLASAPRVTLNEVRDTSNEAWRKKIDRYWRAGR